jgi:hypothetical protein
MSVYPGEAADTTIHPNHDDAGTSDTTLVEDALAAALDAHAAGKLAAPFGLDEVALSATRRRANRADIARRLSETHGDLGSAAPTCGGASI